MPNWIRKSLMVLVSILTLGLVTPSQVFVNQTNNRELLPQLNSNANPLKNEASSEIDSLESDRDTVINKLKRDAEDQAYLKFGKKIKPVIENEFREIVLPNIVNAIEDVTLQFPDEDLHALSITESPGKGDAEKIFHIKNTITNKDIIRFHVRKDHPPLDGYWFNFHYHTYHDLFEEHYYLGQIYWDKNTPPKWMS